MYSTRYCAFCLLAKRLLDQRGVPYREIDVSGDLERRAWLREATGQRTVPQIFIGDRSIGGYQELYGLARSGKLDALLSGG
jgi:glutaredoxin 3